MLNKLILMFLLSSFAGQVAVAAELTTTKAEDIKHLMEITGSANIAKQFASASSKQIFNTLRASRPDIPERALAVLDRELVELFSENISVSGGLMDQVIPIYDKYFTDQEIRELLAFYETPVGRKAVLVLPKVVDESMMAGRRWGQSLAPEIETRVLTALRREGLLPKE